MDMRFFAKYGQKVKFSETFNKNTLIYFKNHFFGALGTLLIGTKKGHVTQTHMMCP